MKQTARHVAESFCILGIKGKQKPTEKFIMIALLKDKNEKWNAKKRGDFDLRLYKRHKKIKIVSTSNKTPYYYYLTYSRKIPEEPGTAKKFIHII